MHRQPGHLDEVAERRFAASKLCQLVLVTKADRGVERQIRRHDRRSEMLRVERQIGLRALQQVDQQEPENAEA